MSAPLLKEITIGDKYHPAMKITEQAEADAYFARCAEHTMTYGHSREEAEQIERSNIGYFAGYYGEEERRRVAQLFRAHHPVFGDNFTPTVEEALEAGRKVASLRAVPHDPR